MKKTLSLMLCAFLLLLLCLPIFTACGDKAEVTLYVYNWGEYISDGSEGSLDANAAFEEWYFETYGQKVKVNYSTYSSNEDMYAKISSGATSYDVIFPSDYMAARLIAEGRVRPLNFDEIPNEEYINYEKMFGDEAPYYDPETRYTVPYTYGTIGIIYNTTMVDEEDIGSWDLMWNEKYEGNILQFNNSRDAFATAQFKIGCSPNSLDESEWRAALEELKTQKGILQGYVMDEIYNKMENGAAAIAAYYAGDFLTMYEKNEDLAFFYPKEGTNLYTDVMCIPADSRNPEVAERYINFMLSEDVAIANAEATYYASPNRLVYENEDYQADMAEVHEDAISILYEIDDLETEIYENLPPEQLTLLNELWESLKIESPINASIIVTAGVIVGSGIVFAVFFAVRKRKRRRIVDALWQ